MSDRIGPASKTNSTYGDRTVDEVQDRSEDMRNHCRGDQEGR